MRHYTCDNCRRPIAGKGWAVTPITEAEDVAHFCSRPCLHAYFGDSAPPPSDAIDPRPEPPVSRQTANRLLDEEPHEYFERIFKGEWIDTTWRVFPVCVNTPELIVAFMRNLPLWMQTRKYLDGFGVNSVKFLQSGVWKKPPDASLMPQQSAPQSGRDAAMEAARARMKAEMEGAK